MESKDIKESVKNVTGYVIDAVKGRISLKINYNQQSPNKTILARVRKLS